MTTELSTYNAENNGTALLLRARHRYLSHAWRCLGRTEKGIVVLEKAEDGEVAAWMTCRSTLLLDSQDRIWVGTWARYPLFEDGEWRSFREMGLPDDRGLL